MVKCSAFDCNSISDRKIAGISFHRFPKNEEKRSAWVQNMKTKDWTPTQNDRLCSKHFEDRFFYRTDFKVKLLNEAIPTIFPELPDYLQPKKESRKRTRVKTPDPQPSTNIQVEVKESPRHKRLKRKLQSVVLKSKVKTRRIRVLNQSLKRYKKKVCSLKQIIKALETNNLITKENSILLENLSTFDKELLRRRVGKKGKYSAELRKFAVTVNFFSPNAYDYIRKTYDTCLPHRSTIGKCYKNINAEPGFSQESLNILKSYVQQTDKKAVLCSLLIDEMAIRKQLEWDGKKIFGNVNFGPELSDDNNALAKEAFVMMIVNVNGTWKLPIGYFFTDSLNGQQKSSLIIQCLSILRETGITVVSLTFDGAPSNITMCHSLGCVTDLENLKSYFTFSDQQIYIFYDSCHMIKLVRNTLGEHMILKDGDGNLINFEFIKKLQSLQESEGLHLGNKLRAAHINFFKQKMKVRLAVQLLSDSVADALEYCENKLNLKIFEGCQATVIFIRNMNTAFDILNSRKLRAPTFKRALGPTNITEVSKFIKYCIEYISHLKFSNDQLVINSSRKTGFIGLILCMKSALGLYDMLVTNQQLLLYLPIYKMSQDHLELFFSSVRSRSGWNNNPTARQFMASYKRLVIRTEVRTGGIGNCTPLEDISILTVSSKTDHIRPEDQINMSIPQFHKGLEEGVAEYNLTLESVFEDHDYIMNTFVLSKCTEEIVKYIAGFVSRHLTEKLKCETCAGALVGNKANFLNSLISQKNRGGLTYPSDDVIRICKICERYLRTMQKDLPKKDCVLRLTSIVMRNCLETNLFQCLNNHALENGVNHIYFLIKAVCIKYIDIRIHFIVKSLSEQRDPIRNHLTKMILFKGQ